MIQNMGPIHPGLSLDFKPKFIPKSIGEFLGQISAIVHVPDRVIKLDGFVRSLEEEMKKIDAFKRELPLCMLLLNDAIVHVKEESTRFRTRNVKPVLEEFIPIKKSCDEDKKIEIRNEKDSSNKMHWMSSVQLWNSDEDSNIKEKQRVDEGNQKIMSKGRIPINGFSVFPLTTSGKEESIKLPVPALSLLTPGIMNRREELDSGVLSSKTTSDTQTNLSSSILNGVSNERSSSQQNTRKQRRCWSPDLHRRFVNALHQLGGSQAATPKQIRELMQVDGLTNDEVKSHLQKYRIHNKKKPGGATPPTPANQAIVVSWMHHSDRSGESSKPSHSQSGSPQGPLQLAGGGTSTTGCDSMEEEEEEEEDDDKSESCSWKNRNV